MSAWWVVDLGSRNDTESYRAGLRHWLRGRGREGIAAARRNQHAFSLSVCYGRVALLHVCS